MKKFLFVLIFAMFSIAVSAEETQKKERFYFFYSDSCPHCHEAMPFIEELEKEFPDIEFKKLELSKAPENLAIFNKKVEKLGIQGGGVPTFVFKDKYIIGFKKGTFEEKIRTMIRKQTENTVTNDNSTEKHETPAVPDKKDKAKKEAPSATDSKEKTPKK